MTKAERIFNDTRRDCAAQIEAFGLERDAEGKAVGFNGLTLRDDDRMTRRLFQDIVDELEHAHHSNDLLLRYKVIDEAEHESKKDVLLMVGETINNEWRRFVAEGRA